MPGAITKLFTCATNNCVRVIRDSDSFAARFPLKFVSATADTLDRRSQKSEPEVLFAALALFYRSYLRIRAITELEVIVL